MLRGLYCQPTESIIIFPPAHPNASAKCANYHPYGAIRARRITALRFTSFRCSFLKKCETVNGAVPERPQGHKVLSRNPSHEPRMLAYATPISAHRHVLCIPSQKHPVMFLSTLERFTGYEMSGTNSRLRPMTLRIQARKKIA